MAGARRASSGLTMRRMPFCVPAIDDYERSGSDLHRAFCRFTSSDGSLVGWRNDAILSCVPGHGRLRKLCECSFANRDKSLSSPS